MLSWKKFYIPQVDDRDCGVAALAMILKYYGSEASLASLQILTHTDLDGTTAYGIIQAAEKLKFDTRALHADMSLFDINDVPYPFIANVIKKEKYSHYYVVYGQKGESILVADPDPMVGLIKLSKERFSSEWTRAVLFLAPNPSYQPVKEKSSSLFSFVPILGKQKKLIVNIIAAALLVAIINIIGSYYLQNIIDDYIPNDLINTLGIISIGLLATYLLSYIRHIFELPMSFFATRRTGEIASRFLMPIRF